MNPNLKLKYIVEMDVEKAKQLVEDNDLNATVLSPSEADTVYQDPQVDGVVICTPTFSHEEYVRAALKHGKGVFCEKPIAGSLEETWACYDEARKAGKPLLCSFNRRFDPGLVQVREKVKGGDVGKVLTIHTIARDHPLPPAEYLRISGGMFHDCGCHDIDLVCWVLGEYPVSVTAEAHGNLPVSKEMNDVDEVIILMRFPSNILASIDLSRNSSYGYDQRIEVLGLEGMVRNENTQATGLEFGNKSGILKEPYLYSFPQRYRESYTNAMQHFADVLKGDVECSVTGNEALAVSIIATACEDSHRQGKKIHLDLSYLQGKELQCPK